MLLKPPAPSLGVAKEVYTEVMGGAAARGFRRSVGPSKARSRGLAEALDTIAHVATTQALELMHLMWCGIHALGNKDIVVTFEDLGANVGPGRGRPDQDGKTASGLAAEVVPAQR